MRLAALPDDLLCRVLSQVDFTSRCRAHQVCRKWNAVLLSPACNDMWHDTPPMDLTPVRTQWTERREKFSRLAHWLSARAATLGVLHISCASLSRRTDGDDEEGGMTDTLYFAERLLPYLFGLLEFRGLRLNLNCLFGKAEPPGTLHLGPYSSRPISSSS